MSRKVTYHWKKLRRIVLERDDYTCRYCGYRPANHKELHADHIIPCSKGGKDYLDNLVTACKDCNSHKHDTDLETFLDSRKWIKPRTPVTYNPRLSNELKQCGIKMIDKRWQDSLIKHIALTYFC